MAVAETTNEQVAIQPAVSGPAKLGQFLKDTREEMSKVVTPTREEVQSTTVIVLITVFLFAAYFAVVDGVVGKLVDAFFQWSTKH